ncbi:SUMF1/EgtB/PvdO family nonheme iron enzyme [Psychromonas sp. MME2]|uniref:formylglycine-generating enzyme family protein n=1 Tax=unclassified Psychromonas TaxID=2614957 RepID=UPI00339C0EB5
MEKQEAIALLQLKGKALTEKNIKQAYNAIAEPIQMEAINASTAELVKKHMATLDSLNQAQTALLDSIDEPNTLDNIAEPSLHTNINSIKESIVARQSNTQIPIIDTSKKGVQHHTFHELPKESKDKCIPQANRQAEINNTNRSTNKLVLIFLTAILLGGGAIAYQQGWLNHFIGNLNSVEKEFFLQQRMEGTQLLEEINTQVQRLDKGQRDLSAELEIAESDPVKIDNLEALHFRQQLIQEYLAEGALLSELAGQTTQAQNILNNQQSKPEDNLQALQLLHDANQAYQNIWQQFNASQHLYTIQQDALQAQAKLMRALETYQLIASSEIAQANLLMDTANATKQAWQYTKAIKYYQEASTTFIALLAHIANLQESKKEAFTAKDKVDQIVKEHNLKSPDIQQASDLMEKAEKSSRGGYIEIAISTYQQAEQHWYKIFGDLARQVEAIQKNKASKEAEIALEAKIAAEAKMALEAKIAAEAQIALEAKIAEEAKIAAEAKQVLEKTRAEKQAQMLNKYVGPLVLIKDGKFQMGSNDGEKSESPVHSVSVKPFKMMAHEVTFEQWQACVNQGACTYLPSDKGWGKGTRPVISVSFNDIVDEYIPWLNKVTGMEFSLPSESQWEYAARAGSTTLYSWGDEIGDNLTNCDSCSRLKHQRTVHVQSFDANPWGLYDMHGNVAEWTQDCWNENYNGALDNDAARLDGNCDMAVLRGGSWNSPPTQLRSANREHRAVSNRDSGNGFRLVQK